jgi:outer membrane protein assembly factor BamB
MSSPSPRDVPPAHIRWWPLIPIVLIGSGLFYAVQVEGFSIIRPARDFTIIVGLVNVLIYIWIRTWSKLRKASQSATVIFLLAVQALLLLIFRFNEFSGDGRILFRWRWAGTPEQRLAEYSSTADERVVVANLAEIGETDSPSFRGADRTGRYHVPELNSNWHEQAPRELWRHPVGRGWSSFAIVGEFCVTQEQRSSCEAVVCYELRTG